MEQIKRDILARIKRMWQIIKLWFFVRKLKKFEYELDLNETIRKIKEGKANESSDKDYPKLKTVFRRLGRTPMARVEIVGKLVIPKIVDKLSENESAIKSSIIQDYIDDSLSEDFLEIVNNSKATVCFTTKGNRFTSFSYLLKYLIKELGVVLSFFVALIGGGVIAGNFMYIIKFVLATIDKFD